MDDSRSGFPPLATIPVALVAFAVVALVGLDAVYGGAARPADPIGDATPVRYAYVEPTPTPTLEPGAQPRPAPTFAPGGGRGSSAERDERRRADLLRLISAANEVREQDGAYPTTNGNVQTICAYQGVDVGCVFSDVLGETPIDPLGDPIQNGYWYSSDGLTATFYAAPESEPEGGSCPTDDPELSKRIFLLCVTVP